MVGRRSRSEASASFITCGNGSARFRISSYQSLLNFCHLAGSIVSGLRLQPGNWAGVYACWGVENREAAVRFVEGGPGSPHGGNAEVKITDPSANPYFASAAILARGASTRRRPRRGSRPSQHC